MTEVSAMEQTNNLAATLEHLTGVVRRLLSHTEDEPVGMLTAYRNSILRLADAVDRLSHELDSRNRESPR
jgi:hypothetical protein